MLLEMTASLPMYLNFSIVILSTLTTTSNSEGFQETFIKIYVLVHSKHQPEKTFDYLETYHLLLDSAAESDRQST